MDRICGSQLLWIAVVVDRSRRGSRVAGRRLRVAGRRSQVAVASRYASRKSRYVDTSILRYFDTFQGCSPYMNDPGSPGSPGRPGTLHSLGTHPDDIIPDPGTEF